MENLKISLENHRVGPSQDHKLQVFSTDGAAVYDSEPTTTQFGGTNKEKEPRVQTKSRSPNCLRILTDAEYEEPMAAKVFTVLQIMSAAFMSFTHGANDTS